MNVVTEFTILLVDDDTQSMGGDRDQIIKYLEVEKKIKKVNFHLIQVDDDSYIKTVNGYLEGRVDMVLADNSMLKPDDGLNLVKNIRDQNSLIDLLLYSTKQITEKDYRDLSYYTQIQTHPEKTIIDITKTLIDRNLAKWNDVVFLRGIVISESIEVELKINEILIKYFEIPDNKKISFENLILGNFSVSLEAKKAELKGVLKETGLEELWTGISNKISNLQSDRNKLAHGKIDPNNVIKFILGGSEVIFDKEKILGMFSNIKEIEEKLSEIEAALQEKDAGKSESGNTESSELTQ